MECPLGFTACRHGWNAHRGLLRPGMGGMSMPEWSARKGGWSALSRVECSYEWVECPCRGGVPVGWVECLPVWNTLPLDVDVILTRMDGIPRRRVGVNLTRVGGVPMQDVTVNELSLVCGVLVRVGPVRMVRYPLG